MKSKVPLIAGVVVLIAIIVVAAVLINHKSSNTSTDSMAGMDMSSDSSSSSSDATATDKVAIKSYKFTPASITVKVGTTVTWTNTDEVHHTVTVDSGSGPSSPLFGQNETYSYTFKTAGTFKYHCSPHPYMHGTVVVTN